MRKSEALNNIAKTLGAPPVTSPKPIDSASQGLAQFRSSSLEAIDNPSLKIETTQSLLNYLLNAQLKDIQ